MFKQLTPAVKL